MRISRPGDYPLLAGALTGAAALPLGAYALTYNSPPAAGGAGILLAVGITFLTVGAGLRRAARQDPAYGVAQYLKDCVGVTEDDVAKRAPPAAGDQGPPTHGVTTPSI